MSVFRLPPSSFILPLVASLVLLAPAVQAKSGEHVSVTPGTVGRLDPGMQQIQDDAQAAVESNRDDPVAHVALGNVYSDQGFYGQAVMEFQTAIEKKPNDFKAHVSMAYAYYKQGDRDKAIGWFKKALKLNPKNVPTWASLAYCYEKNNEWKLAVKAYQQYLKLAPSGDDARLARLAIKDLQDKLRRYGEPKPYALPPP